MYYTYIIKSLKANEFYTGITDNIDRRFSEHNKGKISTKSTYSRGPFDLIHVEILSDRKEARELEKFFKSGMGREIRKELFS